MSITKIRIILLLLCCSISSVWAETRVPEVHAGKHPLLDLYVFARGDFGMPMNCQSLISSKCDALEPLGADAGLGIGFHMPDGAFKYSLRTGYHYQNYTYTKLYSQKGISLHYINLDARVTFFDCSYFGMQSNILLSSSLPNDLPQEYLGFNMECFSPATIKPYVGFAFPLTANLSADFTFGGEFMLFNKRMMKTYLPYNTIGIDTYALIIEVGLTYRIFTSGKRQQLCVTF